MENGFSIKLTVLIFIGLVVAIVICREIHLRRNGLDVQAVGAIDQVVFGQIMTSKRAGISVRDR